MLAIDNVIISDDILNQYFACDIFCCKGSCCIEGDAGAPLEEEEIAILEDYIDKIKPYMSEKSVEILTQMGVFDYDMEGVLVTPLVNDSECIFVYFEENAAKCAIEKAYLEGKIDFQKPISCHLYPIRIKKSNGYDVLKYHQWEVCKDAKKHGKYLNISLFDYLKIPLTIKYGKEWIDKVKKNFK
jgi:hypothetical protein